MQTTDVQEIKGNEWRIVWKDSLQLCMYIRRLEQDKLALFYRWYTSTSCKCLNNCPSKVLTIIQCLDESSKILKVTLFITNNFLDVDSSFPWVAIVYLIDAHSHHFQQRLYMPPGMSTARLALLSHTLLNGERYGYRHISWVVGRLTTRY